jgi:predicted secreted protein
MDIASGIVVFLITWWVVLFTVLPWGVTRDDGGPETTGPGAPKDPKLKKKFIVTTLISVVVWVIIYALIEMQIVDLYEIGRQMAEEDYG